MVYKLLAAAYGRSVLLYFGVPLVCNEVWDFEKINSLEIRQRRQILGLGNNNSNTSIKGKTAHWFARPLANSIVDIAQSQKLLPEDSINYLKQSNCYWSNDKIDTTK